MNTEKISKGLTYGLVAGYGGKTEFNKTNRAGFAIKSSHFESEEIIYHDEWTNNGGQELITVNGESFTRLYGGGVTNSEILQSLNISEDDVINNLKERIVEFGDKTRLFSDFKTETKNNWDYEYKILDKNEEIEVTTGKETISYKNQPVFIHVFILSPIK